MALWFQKPPTCTEWLRGGLCIVAFLATVAIALCQEPGSWRRTEKGWEFMGPQFVQGESMLAPLQNSLLSGPALSDWIKFHRCLVPVAVAGLLATSGGWFLIALPMRRDSLSLD